VESKEYTELKSKYDELLKKFDKQRINNVATGINQLASTASTADIIDVVNKLLQNIKGQ
jgi:hypothetical protein